MIVDIVMPKMGESITEGTILEWRKKVGEFVEKDELFLEIGTDKVDSEIPCVESGTLVEILADVNDVVEVWKTIAKIETKTPAKNESDPSASQEKILDNSKNFSYFRSKFIISLQNATGILSFNDNSSTV